MKQNRSIRLSLTCALGLVLAVALGAAHVEAAEPQWQVRGFGVGIDADMRSDYFADGVSGVRTEYGSGIEATLEYRVSPRLGVELGHILGAVGTNLYGVHSSTSGVAGDSRNLGFSAITLALNVHLTPGERLQLYVSPILSKIDYSNWDYEWYDSHSGNRSAVIVVGDDFAWGIGLGLDIPVAESAWSVSLSARYLDTSLDTSDRSRSVSVAVPFDPVVVGVGFGFRF